MNAFAGLLVAVVIGGLASAYFSFMAYAMDLLPACVHLTYSTCY